MAGIVTLYTREYFELVHDRLNEGGIVSYWLPVHDLSPDDSKSIVRAFCDVFPDCSLWGGAGLDWILLGTRNADGPGNLERFTQQWSDPVVGPELDLLAVELPELLGALFMAGPEDLAAMAGDALPLTDDHPKRLSEQPFKIIEGLDFYVPWMDKSNTRERFEQSGWIQKIWPQALRSSTPSYFSAQWEINRALIERSGLNLEVVLPKVHVVLTRTDLTTLPLWMLHSDGLRQRAARIALEKGTANAAAYGDLALGALSQRNYARAYELFSNALRAGATGPRMQTATLYALFMSNDPDGRRELVQNLVSAGSASTLEPWVVPFFQTVLASQ
jgi:hypothetical protein